MLQTLKRFYQTLQGQYVDIRPTLKKETEWYGNDYGGFYVCPEKLSSSSIVYSFGIGEDISFDMAIVEKHSCHVFGFDPTPKSVAWVQRQTLPKNFHFYPYGIGIESGTAQFYLPKNESHVSGSLLSLKSVNTSQAVTVSIKSFSDITRELRHDRVDIVKMDIEGSEYDIIPALLKSEIRIDQILVEFHHRLIDKGAQRTRKIISMLKESGYEVVAFSSKGLEASFIKTN